jgi:hypothetical protein
LSELLCPIIRVIAKSPCPLTFFPRVSHLNKVNLLTVSIINSSSGKQ